MRDAGVVVSFNSDSDELARRLNIEAAKAVKYGGVPPEEALKFVTLNPAKQLRIEDRVGSIEVGKDADFVVWSGDPLSSRRSRSRDVDRRPQVLRPHARTSRAEAPTAKRAQPSCARSPKATHRRAAERGQAGRSGRDAGLGRRGRNAGDERRRSSCGAAMTPAPLCGCREASPCATVHDRRPARRIIAIVGATIHPVSGPEIAGGTIVFDHGKIVSVGAGARAGGREVVDGKGKHVYPSLIDRDEARPRRDRRQSLDRATQAEAGRDHPERARRRGDQPRERAAPGRAPAGVLLAHVTPGGGSSPGTARGDGARRLDARGRDAQGPGRDHDLLAGSEDQPFSRREPHGQEARRRATKRSNASGRPSGTPGRTAKRGAPSAPRECRSTTSTRASRRFFPRSTSRSRGGASAAARADPRRAEVGVGREAASRHLGRRRRVADGGRARESRRARDPGVAARASGARRRPVRRGVRGCGRAGSRGRWVAFNDGGDDASNIRNFPQLAAMAVAYGYPREKALAALTLEPARILGVDAGIGSIEPGEVRVSSSSPTATSSISARTWSPHT